MAEPPADVVELFEELVERAGVLAELNGPQIEAWVSGMIPVLADEPTVAAFVEHCEGRPGPVTALLCRALETLCGGAVSARASAAAMSMAAHMPGVGEEIDRSTLTRAWRVRAPFGRSVVLGFELASAARVEDLEAAHSILVEVAEHGGLEDLQLAGAPDELLAEAAGGDPRVVVEGIAIDTALEEVAAAWPVGEHVVRGPGLVANEAFVRARLRRAGRPVAPIVMVEREIDVRRGHDAASFAAANRAALSTLRAAMGREFAPPDSPSAHSQAWLSVVRGDAADLSPRERDALLWLEWADWLGAGIGVLRAGVGAAVTGATLVEHVNRCPEVSSTIHATDRDYAEWAFTVAIDVLEHAGVLRDGVVTDAGYAALGPALAQAWGADQDPAGTSSQ